MHYFHVADAKAKATALERKATYAAQFRGVRRLLVGGKSQSPRVKTDPDAPHALLPISLEARVWVAPPPPLRLTNILYTLTLVHYGKGRL